MALMQAAPLSNLSKLLTPAQRQQMAAEAVREAQRRIRLAQRPTSATTPEAWSRSTATIVHPVRGRIPFVPYPYQAEFLANYHQPRRIVLKARQIGFSQVFALEALYAAITEPESTVLLVSRSQDLAVNLLRYCYLTFNNLRDAPEMVKANESEMGFANGSRIKSIPANRSTGRGFTANRVYLDEFAYAEYDHDIYQSVSPAVSQGGFLVIGSTPNGVGNLFHELYIAGDGFSRQSVPWYECPAYWTESERALHVPREQARWYLKERPKYTAQQWASEFDCDFVGSGDAVFRVPDIDAATEGAVGEQAPLPEHRYLTSVDIGRRQDATVINVTDISVLPFQRVHHERHERIPYPLIQEKIEYCYRVWPGQLYIESNGPGDPVIENLDVPANAFVTTARSKVQALQALALLLENRLLKALWTDQERKELTIYQWDDKNLVQDCVMSLAVAASELVEMTDLAQPGTVARTSPTAPSRLVRVPPAAGRFGRGETRGWRRR
jgi:hypothetical protein